MKVFCAVICHRLQQVEENRKSVTNEIKKSICDLIMEINRKGKILVNHLEVIPPAKLNDFYQGKCYV